MQPALTPSLSPASQPSPRPLPEGEGDKAEKDLTESGQTLSPNRPIVIIGSGLAGYTVLREFRKRDQATPVTLICADDGHFYSKPNLSNALAAGKGAEQLVNTPREKMASDLKAEILANTRVTAIDTVGKKVRRGDGETGYSKLVLALGADAIPHGLTGPGSEKVFAVNDLQDYATFRAALKPGGKVAILGGGLIGSEFANDLAASGHKVEVVHLGPWPLERLIPEQVGRALADALAEKGVAWHFGRTAKAIEPVGEGIGLTLDDGSRVEADIVLSAIGLRSRTQLAASAGLQVNRGIVVDKTLQASAADVYAAGDCAEVGGQVLPYVLPLMQQARALAATLAGETTEVRYPVMPVVVKTPALPLAVLPPAPGAEGGWQVECFDDGICALHLDNGRLLQGFALAGRQATQRAQYAAKVGQAVSQARTPAPQA
jgi:NAD(P)H-nitrite reductase